MNSSDITRRAVFGAGAAIAGGSLLGGHAFAEGTAPTSPVALNVMDIAGDLALTQHIFEDYAKAKPNWVSRISFSKAPMPELPAKLKAQQNAGHVDIDIVVTGFDGITPGVELGLWVQLLPNHASSLPNLDEILLPGARRIQALTQGQAVVHAYSPYGMVIEYMPDRVKTPPKIAQEMMDWATQNPNRFIYSRPANSGPARALLTGLPYILGDSNPTDPVKGWSKTWNYLKALGEYVEYYPSGAAGTYKEFGEGSRDMMPSHHRLGHQSPRARHRAEGSQDLHARRLPLGERRALHRHPEGRRTGEDSGHSRPDRQQPPGAAIVPGSHRRGFPNLGRERRRSKALRGK